jgi:hypothetical protein
MHFHSHVPRLLACYNPNLHTQVKLVLTSLGALLLPSDLLYVGITSDSNIELKVCGCVSRGAHNNKSVVMEQPNPRTLARSPALVSLIL